MAMPAAAQMPAAAPTSATGQLSAAAHAPSAGLRPVPKSTSQIAPRPSAAAPHDPRREGWNLQWRKSPELAETAAPAVAKPNTLRSATTTAESTVAASTANTVVAAKQRDVFDEPPATLRQVGHSVELAPAPVTHAAWAQPQLGMPANAPVPDAAANQFELPSQADEEPVDFFTNPFGDERPELEPAPQRTAPRRTESQPSLLSPQRSTAAPQGSNQLRAPSSGASDALPTPTAPTLEPAPAAPRGQATPEDSGRSLRDMLRSERPEPEDRDAVESPSDRERMFSNPFDARDEADEADEPAAPDRAAESPQRAYGVPELDLANTGNLSCEDFRQRIAAQTIRDVSLDISPPFRPDVIEEDEYQKLKARFDDKQPSRQWRSIAGQPIATGRLTDLAYEKAIIKTEQGTTQELPINQLSEGDLAYISENWGLPAECLIEQVAYQPRAWTPTTMTWKASNLCHKPLYFEEVNLERYGHTAGPFLQPVVSSAHFFANIAVLPYKMGIHPPGECQYALGYYRPGNCAPWIVPPVPISLRGGLTQAAAMTGAFWLIP